ncbi:hypothetical protein SEA_BANQUO_19 [Gordonia phage Banquo]|nr:hypothetical protein SEA_BANQUO_19 [Gordonia phage Banquo]
MGMYRRTFAVPHKGQHVGDVVELSDDVANPLLAFGRIVRVDESPAIPATKAPKPATKPAAVKADAAGGDA